MFVSVSYDFLPKQPSTLAALVMDHFGIGFETGPHVIAERVELPIQPGAIVAFIGASGSGKSSLMRAAAGQLAGVVASDQLELGSSILVDGLGLPGDEALALLAGCGLGEAQLLLRTPTELSDGQRYRYRLAKAFAARPQWIVADEFTAALDRPLAKVIAFNVQKLARRLGIGVLVATTHQDILPDLSPDLTVECRLEGAIECRRATAEGDTPEATATTGASVEAPWSSGSSPVPAASSGLPVVKKKRSASPGSCNSRPERHATGRISLGGIIGVITSGSSAT